MPIKDHRLKTGTLTIDALPFATQATNVTLEPDVDEEGDELETLSGDTESPEEVYSWSLNITAIQDFDDPAGFVRFCKDNAGQEVPFSWRPNAAGVTFSGTVKVRPVSIGGDVATRLDTSAEFPVIGDITDTDPV
jgi:hypothetical protein